MLPLANPILLPLHKSELLPMGVYVLSIRKDGLGPVESDLRPLTMSGFAPAQAT